MTALDIQQLIRTVPDFPKKGIMFRDITTLLQNGPAFARTLDMLVERYAGSGLQKIAGIESRGFILGGALAARLGLGFIPIRKPGKLPAATLRQEYQLEYGTDAIEMHADAVAVGERVLVHDDLLATGGTMHAACSLIERAGGVVTGVSVLIELAFLPGRRVLAGRDVHSLVVYDRE